VCSVPGDDGVGAERGLVVRVPQRDAGKHQPEQARREAALLERLSELELSFLIPEVVALIPIDTGVAMVQRWVSGFPLEMRARRSPVSPWDVIGEIAAKCHGIPAERFIEIVPFYPSRRAHAVAMLAVLDELAVDEFADARQWAIAHLPPETPARLLHGDLLGQNLLLGLERDGPIGVIDWAAALVGDPAYDLAIVIRGVRRPFGVGGGLNKLLDSYNAHSDVELKAQDVRLYELCLAASWWVEEEASRPGSSHAMNQQQFFMGLLKRCLEER
jgi:aminoglycoside phosphotransferase (APT) family kinase protein